MLTPRVRSCMHTASGLAILSHSRPQNPERERGAPFQNPARERGAPSASGGFSAESTLRIPPWIRPVPEPHIGLLPKRHHASKGNGCCHGEPSVDDLGRRAQPRLRHGCYTISWCSIRVLACSSPWLQRGHDLCERERPKASSLDNDTLPASFSKRLACGLNPDPCDEVVRCRSLTVAVL
jgi:hypothetical protein